GALRRPFVARDRRYPSPSQDSRAGRGAGRWRDIRDDGRRRAGRGGAL
ncbi:MAG: hypothetical protein AVDCRST_MAG59-639, partial [uncultured Thermomicrobiales bacterium]